MKVILKDEVDNLGLAGDVVEVADGYGRNYLIPSGLAIIATRGALKEARSLTRARKARQAKTLEAARQYKEVLESRMLRIEARMDDKGHLYGSVGAADVRRVLKERGHELEPRRIGLKRAIKEIGSYTVPVHLHPEVTAEVPVTVVDLEGEVTVEKLTAEREGRPPEEAESLAERAIAAADEAEVPDEPAPTSEALAARAAEPTEVDRPVTVEELREDERS